MASASINGKKIEKASDTYGTLVSRNLQYDFISYTELLLDLPDINNKAKQISQVGSLNLLNTSVSEERKVPGKLLNFYYIARVNDNNKWIKSIFTCPLNNSLKLE